MAHSITALVVRGPYLRSQMEQYDLRAVPLTADLTLFHIDHYYSAVWQNRLGLTGHLCIQPTRDVIMPNEMALMRIACELRNMQEPEFAIVATEYFGGLGEQCGVAFCGQTPLGENDGSINCALRCLGVVCQPPLDEFDTVGLHRFRENPAYLEKYKQICEELDV